MSNGLRRVNTLSALVLACAVVAFARSLTFGFVYDDHWTIEGAPLDKPLLHLLSLLFRGAARAHHIPDETRPTMVASVWIDHALFREAPAGYHADSLFLYGALSVIVLWAAFALGSRIRVAIVAALVFALAPLHTEVVCAINYREDILASIGVLVPLTLLVGRAKTTRLGEFAALATFAMGLLAKESALTLAPIIAVVCALSPRLRKRVMERRELLLGLAGVLLVWIWWRGAVLARGDDIPRAHYPSVAARIFASARFFVRTSIATLFPVLPAPEHARLEAASPIWVVPLVAWIGVIAALARRRATRLVALGLALVLVAPLPTSPLFAPANEIADRYAFLGVIGAGIAWGSLASRVPRRLATPVVVAACVALFIVCQVTSAPWHDDLALWSKATACAPESPRAWAGLARARRLSGDLAEADRDVDHAIALDPKFIGARVTRVYNLLGRGDVAAARGELATIHDLGGDRHAGVSRAAECAALGPDEARICAQ